MMESLKETFPEKGGEASTWKFGKFHNVKHVPLWIIFLGWIEIFSGQSGERGHRELLKSLAHCVNNRDVYAQYLRYWERVELLSRARREHHDSEGDSSDSEMVPTVTLLCTKWQGQVRRRPREIQCTRASLASDARCSLWLCTALSFTTGLAKDVLATLVKGDSASISGCSVMFRPRQCERSRYFKTSHETWQCLHTCTAGCLWAYLYQQTKADCHLWTSSTMCCWDIFAVTNKDDMLGPSAW